MIEKPLMGKCHLCDGTFKKAAMTRHLSACSQPDPKPARAVKRDHSFHVVVEGRYGKSYWMHLAVPVDAPLSILDDYLRRTWLECCGHLSAFSIDGKRYAAQAMEELEEKGMEKRLDRVVDVGDKFRYEYDYGSTTELALRVVARRDQAKAGWDVQLLARNEAPQVNCDRCRTEIATTICMECESSGEGWLCNGCAKTHECGNAMFLPVVNSPRAGVCAYSG